jgi:GTP 3',8-cyclase
MPLGDAALMHPYEKSRIGSTEIGPVAGCGAQDRGEGTFISEAEVRSRIEAELGELAPVDRSTEPGMGPANVYRLANGRPLGRIGFISAMSAPFCSTCNRLRLTADGVLRSCLFDGGEVPILDLLRSEIPGPGRRQKLADAMTKCVQLKPDVHSGHGNQQMSRLGG